MYSRGLGKHPHGFSLQCPIRSLPRIRVRSGESHASDNGFELLVARFQAIEIPGQDQRDPLILADANAGAIDIDLSTTEALPALIKFHHGLDSASCLPIFL